jgi:anti-sigma regulatory factor (Ser/Thr protein kinase)
VTDRALWPLEQELGAASQARALLTAHCYARHPQIDQSTLHTALLLASELVTNAVRHGTGPLDLEVIDGDDRFRVNVSDHSAQSPVPQTVDMFAESGRGLMLVETLSSTWGVTQRPGDGKCVWFELPPLRDSANRLP